MRRTLIKYGLLALVCAAVTAACYLVTIATHHQNMRDYRAPEGSVSVLNQAQLTAVNAKLDADGAFRVRRSDAQLYISGIDQPLRTLCFVMRDPLPADEYCQLFYARNGSGYSEQQSLTRILAADTNQVAFYLTDDVVYDGFRLDIDRSYVLEDILISSDVIAFEEVTHSGLMAEGRIAVPWNKLIWSFALLYAAGMSVLGAAHKRKNKDALPEA